MATKEDEETADNSVAAQYAAYSYEQLKTMSQQQAAQKPETTQQANQQTVASQSAAAEQLVAQQYAAQQYAALQASQYAPAPAPVKVYRPPPSYAYERRGAWEKLFDESSGHIYYRNVVTLTSQWKMPTEWSGEAPLKHEEVKVDNPFMPDVQMEARQKELMKRPARRQAAADEKHKAYARPEGANEYNIWHHKWFGEHWAHQKETAPALTRCVMERDCGFTKADLVDPEGKTSYYCVHFARGNCNLGAECTFYHRIPTEADVARIEPLKDCFGRDRHRTHRDDMGGAGAFDADCRTLYVGGCGTGSDVERTLWKEFGEFGTPEHINVVRRLNIAFIRYHNRHNAEFAKIAMGDQMLGGLVQINVRWAYEDPNPTRQTEKMMEQRARVLEAAVKRGFLTEHGEEPELKRRLNPAVDNLYTGYYPNTDVQFSSGPKTQEEIEHESNLKQMAEQYSMFDAVLNKIGK